MKTVPLPIARDPRGPSEAAALRHPPSRPSRMSVSRVSDSAIGGVLRNARRRRGITQSDAAAAMQVNIATIRDWETGHCRIPPVRMAALTALLGISESDLRRAEDIAWTHEERVLLVRFRSATEQERQAALKAVCP